MEKTGNVETGRELAGELAEDDERQATEFTEYSEHNNGTARNNYTLA